MSFIIHFAPLTGLPFYEYPSNWRKLNVKRKLLKIFDKLDAPQAWFITRGPITSWFSTEQFTNVRTSSDKEIVWRGSGTKRGQKAR